MSASRQSIRKRLEREGRWEEASSWRKDRELENMELGLKRKDAEAASWSAMDVEFGPIGDSIRGSLEATLRSFGVSEEYEDYVTPVEDGEVGDGRVVEGSEADASAIKAAPDAGIVALSSEPEPEPVVEVPLPVVEPELVVVQEVEALPVESEESAGEDVGMVRLPVGVMAGLPWQRLSAEAEYREEALWVHQQYMMVVDEGSGVVRWERSTHRPPSVGACSLMAWAASNRTAFYKDVLPKALREESEGEGELVRGERKSILEIGQVLERLKEIA